MKVDCAFKFKRTPQKLWGFISPKVNCKMIGLDRMHSLVFFLVLSSAVATPVQKRASKHGLLRTDWSSLPASDRYV